MSYSRHLVLLSLLAIPAAAAQLTQCPPTGLSTGCNVTAVATDKGISIIRDPFQGPFQNLATSTLVGFLNNSSTPISALALNGNGLPIMQFNGNGLCSVGVA